MEGKIVESIDILSLVQLISKKRKMHQKVFLDALEKVISKDSPQFIAVRKLFLDHTNDFSRDIVREVFGESFEGEIK